MALDFSNRSEGFRDKVRFRSDLKGLNTSLALFILVFRPTAKRQTHRQSDDRDYDRERASDYKKKREKEGETGRKIVRKTL